MRLKFWKKQEVISPENCDHLNTKLRMLNELKVPLADGHFTSFMVGKCGRCGGMCAFPQDNLEIALNGGTEATKDQLRVLSERVQSMPLAIVSK